MQNQKYLVLVLALISIVAIFPGCSKGFDGEWEPVDQEDITTPTTRRQWNMSRAEEIQMLDNTFRIDIKNITVVFDYYTASNRVDGHAVVEFEMRAGQSRPVIHLTPAVRNKTVDSILLDNESLDFGNQDHIKVVDFDGSKQSALEFQRDLAQGVRHTLEMRYHYTLPNSYEGFYTDVHDSKGNGNEDHFPTINSPHELARHHITFRVHSGRSFRCIGSGLVQRTAAPGVQEWTLDTEREIASYTIMWAILAQEDTHYREHTIGGVPIRIMAYKGGGDIDAALSYLEPWIPQLIRDIGPFPMPRGLSIFLTADGGGMEYFGGTITSVAVIKHEITHMYSGCSVINMTYRDSWLDEAMDEYYENSIGRTVAPISPSFKSDIVSWKSPIETGFDMRAYEQGSRILAAVAEELGGRERMLEFYRYIYENYRFKPFTTHDYLDYLEDFAGINMRGRFARWVYNQGDDAATSTTETKPRRVKEPVNMTPPASILEKYNK